MVNGYLCAVDRCVYEFFDETKNDKFELMWRKMPDSLNWCATNAQMSVTKFTSKKEILMFKVKNMMERKKQKTDEKCTAVVISFDDDSSLKDLDLERTLKTCTVHYVDFSSSRIHGLAKLLKSFDSVIDVLIVGPSKSSSHLLFQHFFGDYYNYLPTVCQINFAHTLPRPREENGFMESIQRLLSEKKFLLMGASKDRTDMHVNLFFENMDQKYCRDRYFRYLSYF
uniref:Protein FAR1-RELATED SEQUENCE n=1 Tax=Caenorhabditis tropicalis TaxID=1561998 RepID=A0A1I7TXT5_9PELO